MVQSALVHKVLYVIKHLSVKGTLAHKALAGDE